MTGQNLAQLLESAGFEGIESDGPVVFARILGPAGPEVEARVSEGQLQLTMARPLRVSDADLARWNAAHPHALLDIFQGETRLLLRGPADRATLLAFGALAESFAAKAVLWRRHQRAGGEGM